ncbi:MAG: hypothetical protein A2X64_08690 [Ignavibacteria bacterium GWF2_33_9]|nr:MAG: hypothetical protein A2X64_08690 [Ignavibacteria bacterium GWF2_33_9]
MRIKISITQKHFVYFLLLSLLSIIIVGWYSFYISKNAIIKRTFDQLTSVRVEKSKNLFAFFHERDSEVLFLSNYIENEFKKSNTSNILNVIESKNGIVESFLNKKVYFNKVIIIFNNNVYEIDNKSVSEYELSSYDKKNRFAKIMTTLDKSENADSLIYDDDYTVENGSISFIIAKRFALPDKKELQLYFQISSNYINSIMSTEGDMSGLGKTGETYIVGGDYLLRTSSRFKENSIKNIEVKTIASMRAMVNESSTKIIKDYRSVEVLSSFAPLHLKNLKWAVIAEIDKKEALVAVYNLRNSIVILCLVLSLFIFGFVYLGSLKITNPVKQLSEAANKISEGEFNVIIENKSNDEIGELINSFNNMARVLFVQSEQLNKEQLLRISYVLDAQEKERQRLSRDLHDGLGQMLLAAKLKLEQMASSDFEKAQKHLNGALEIMKETVNEIRTISNDLMPSVLSNFGLGEGIKRLCKDFEKDSGIAFNFDCTNLDKIDIPEKSQLYIFRIVQELMNNILKHSQAKNASLRFTFDGNFLTIQVNDDGIGFDTSNIDFGNGINNIMERTELLYGRIKVSSKPSQGTEVLINIPVKYGKN